MNNDIRPPMTIAMINNGFHISITTTTMMYRTVRTAAVTPNNIRPEAKSTILTCSKRAAKVPLERAYSRTPKITIPIRINAIQMPASPNASFARP